MIEIPKAPTPTKGSLFTSAMGPSFQVWPGAGIGPVRHERIRFFGQCNADGDFELTLPYINGQLRGFKAWEVDSATFPISSNAKLNMELIETDDGTFFIPVTAQVSFASSGSPARLQAAGGATADSYTTTTSTLAAHPVRIRISTATANGKFVFEMIVRVQN